MQHQANDNYKLSELFARIISCPLVNEIKVKACYVDSLGRYKFLLFSCCNERYICIHFTTFAVNEESDCTSNL